MPKIKKNCAYCGRAFEVWHPPRKEEKIVQESVTMNGKGSLKLVKTTVIIDMDKQLVYLDQNKEDDTHQHLQDQNVNPIKESVSLAVHLLSHMTKGKSIVTGSVTKMIIKSNGSPISGVTKW